MVAVLVHLAARAETDFKERSLQPKPLVSDTASLGESTILTRPECDTRFSSVASETGVGAATAEPTCEEPNIAGVGMGGSGFRADGVLYISQVNTRGHSGWLATGLHEVRRGEANESKVKIASREVRLC